MHFCLRRAVAAATCDACVRVYHSPLRPGAKTRVALVLGKIRFALLPA
jgi:hypothetical protein